jgi:hypothetical protein
VGLVVDPAYIAFRAVVDFLFTGAGAFAAADALAAGCADPRGAAALGAAARGADPAEEVLVDVRDGEDGVLRAEGVELARSPARKLTSDRC